MIQQAKSHDRPVGVCGEMAADPLGAVALAALGADRLSVPVRSLRAVRRVLGRRNPAVCEQLGAPLLAATRSREVRKLLEAASA